MTSHIKQTVAILAILLATTLYADPELTGLDYPYAGVSLIGPTDWFGKPVTCKFVVACWEQTDPDTYAVQGAIEVRALPADDMTLQQFADGIGQQFHARVVDKTLTLDGVTAWQMEAASTSDKLAIRGAIVAQHDGVLYAIVGNALPNHPWLPAARQVMEKWKWIPVEAPDKQFHYTERWAGLLRDTVWIHLPVGMGMLRPDSNWSKPTDFVTLSLVNFKKGTDEFQVTASLQDRRADETIDAFRDRLLASLQPRTKEPLAWCNVPEWDARRMTKSVKVADGIYEQYACVEVDHKLVAVLTFRTAADTDEDRAFYQRQAEFMIRDMVIREPRVIRPLIKI